MFFAVLISSLALAIGVAMYDLVVRQLQLSSTTEQSQYAIYAAESAVECAMYWDSKYQYVPYLPHSIFATSSGDGEFAHGATKAICAGTDITNFGTNGWLVTSTPTSATSTTNLQTGLKTNAFLMVTKTFNPVTGYIETKIYSHGFNVASTASNAVERELQVTY